jgi:hypothetical protein
MEDAELIVKQWLAELALTTASRDLEAHMALVSPEVQVHGLRRAGVIDFEGWRKRRHNEFRNGLVHSLTHKNVHVISAERGHIVFTVTETLKGTRGEVIVIDKQVVLKRDERNRWRVVLEQIEKVDLKKKGGPQPIQQERQPEQ